MDVPIFIVEMLILGIAVGVVSAALGIGGGILMVPAFVEFVDGMDIHTAKGSSLFIIVFVAAMNAWRLNRNEKTIPWVLAGLIAVGSVVGAYFSSWGTGFMPEGPVTLLFVALLCVIAYRFVRFDAPTVKESDVSIKPAPATGIGLLSGLVSGATGVGGGAVIVPLALMARLASNRRVTGLSNMVMAVTCLSAAIAHFMQDKVFHHYPFTIGQVNLLLAPVVFLGAQIGSPWGKWINDRITLPQRKIAMAVLTVVISLRLLYRTFFVL